MTAATTAAALAFALLAAASAQDKTLPQPSTGSYVELRDIDPQHVFLDAVVELTGAQVDGMTTYWLGVQPKYAWTANAGAFSIYAIFGDNEHQGATTMTFPPAFQEPAPFGADIGGVNPLLVALSPTAATDSWLTVGVNEGSSAGSIATVGIDFTQWTDTQPLAIENGAVFWMDPTAAPQLGQTGAGGSRVQVAQLTVPTGTAWRAVVNIQGKDNNADDWKHHGLVFDNTRLVQVAGAAAAPAFSPIVGH